MHVAAAVLVVATQLALVAPARAQAQMEFIPSATLFAVYDDNVFARVQSDAGQLLQLRPSFEGSYESPRTRLLGLYSFDMQRSNFSSLTTFDARRHALADVRFRTSPFTTIGMAARYDRSETPGEINFDTGLLGERRQAERLQVTPAVSRRLSTRSTVDAAYDWATEYLVGGERGTLHTGRATYSRQITTKTTLSGSYVGRYFTDGIGEHYSQALLLAWTRTMGPGTRVTLSAGPRSTSYRGLAPEVVAGFARTTPRVRMAIDYWHGETIVLGIQGPVALDSATTRLTWPLTRRFEFGTHAGVSDISTLDDRRSTIYRGTLVASWSPGGMYSIASSYAADFQRGSIRHPIFLDDEPILLDDRVLRHVFRVGVTVAPRYKRSILPPDEAARAKGVSR